MGLIRRTHFTLSVFRTNHPLQQPSLSQVLFGQNASSHRTNAPSPQTMSVFHSLAVVPIFGFYVALTPSDHFRIDSKQSLAISQNYQSLLPFKRKRKTCNTVSASSKPSVAFSLLQEHLLPCNYPEYQSKQQSLLQSHCYYRFDIQEELLLQHLPRHYRRFVSPYELEDIFYTTHYMEHSDSHSL